MKRKKPLTRKKPLSAGAAGSKPRARISPFSKAPHKVARRAAYTKAKAEFWDETAMAQLGLSNVLQVTPAERQRVVCQARVPLMGHGSRICVRLAVDLHHKAGRNGTNLTDKSTFMAVCRQCHDWIHANPSTARAMGYLIQ